MKSPSKLKILPGQRKIIILGSVKKAMMSKTILLEAQRKTALVNFTFLLIIVSGASKIITI